MAWVRRRATDGAPRRSRRSIITSASSDRAHQRTLDLDPTPPAPRGPGTGHPYSAALAPQGYHSCSCPSPLAVKRQPCTPHARSSQSCHAYGQTRSSHQYSSSSSWGRCLVFTVLCFLHVLVLAGMTIPPDAEHLTAMLGESVIFNCHVEFPEGSHNHPIPYVVQWHKKDVEIPIYVWYDNYPTHSGEGYEGRVAKVPPGTSYGLAALNLTDIQSSDQGWYECKVVFLNRTPPKKNGTWFYLDVHAPPRFTFTPQDVVYVSLGDSVILTCQAEGTPTPEILWYRYNDPIQPSSSLAISNEGTELRLASIRQEDIGDYVCIARNGEGRVHHTTKVVVAGGAVIVVPPHNTTRLEGERVEMACEARAHPANVSVQWLRESVPVKSLSWLESRVNVRKDGALVINPVSAEDRGTFTCEVSNGIGEPQKASAFLEVEFPARVSFTPTVQYLPFRLSGVVRCHVEANPPFQFITWTKDKRIFDPFETQGVVVLTNGSLLFQKVSQDHQGRYTCTPYNVHGTAGSSGIMEVLVREPPVFQTRPQAVYQRKLDDEIRMECEAQGAPPPTLTWRRLDGRPLPRDRTRVENGHLVLTNLKRGDFGGYECVASNEVATLIAATQLMIEGTTPHAPYNVTAESGEFHVDLEWQPGYAGGTDYVQKYVIWYRQEGASKWIPFEVDPASSTRATVLNLQPGTPYEFQVIGRNHLGEGMASPVVRVPTKGQIPPTPNPPGPSRLSSMAPPPQSQNEEKVRNYSIVVYPTDEYGSTYIPTVFKPKGLAPFAPRNLTLAEQSDGYLLTWTQPREDGVAVAYYTVDYCADNQWKRLSKSELKPSDSSFLVKNLLHGRTYYFRVNAHTLTNQASSEKLKFVVPQRVKDKAITAGIVGGILFFIVAIILSVCAVKICNKRRRRKQEKAYNMVACRVTDARNGSQGGPKQVPLKKGRPRRLPSLTATYIKALRRPFQQWKRRQIPHRMRRNGSSGDVVDGRWAGGGPATEDQQQDPDWQEYGGGVLRRRRVKPVRYSVEAQFSQPAGWISRTPDGKFVLDASTSSLASPWSTSSPSRPLLETHFPVSAFSVPYTTADTRFGDALPAAVVESGVYRIGGSRAGEYHRPQPILHREVSPLPTPTGARIPAAVWSPEFGRHRIPELATIYTPASRKEMRASSPGPGLGFLSPTTFSDVSSVRQPSSVERSFPTTLISSRLSTSQFDPATPQGSVSFGHVFPYAMPLSPSTTNTRYMRELPALRPIQEHLRMQERLTPRFQTQVEIHTPRSSLPLRPVVSASPDLGLLVTESGRHVHHIPAPPYIPPPNPLRSQMYRPLIVPSATRPLATSSPPRSRTSWSRRRSPSTLQEPRISPKTSEPWVLHRPPDNLGRTRASLVSASSGRGSSAREPRLTVTTSQPHRKLDVSMTKHSPQSLSSSSGFESKNTSQQNQSSQSGSGSGHSQLLPGDSSSSWSTPPTRSKSEGIYVNWPPSSPPRRELSPTSHRPPPWPSSVLSTSSPTTTVEETLTVEPSSEELTDSVPWPSPRPLTIETSASSPPLLDVLDASVDNHYEFDSAQSPGGGSSDVPEMTLLPSPSRILRAPDPSGPGPPPKVRKLAKYENVEARVQAMKEEFQEYRKKRAKTGELESVC